MKVAIVGSGVSGLTCAYLLHKKHDVTIFEGSKKAGGHVNTVQTEGQTGTYNVDTGFIVFNKDGDECFSFGKHKGKTVENVLENEPGYFGWLLNADFPMYTKKVLTGIRLRKLNT